MKMMEKTFSRFFASPTVRVIAALLAALLLAGLIGGAFDRDKKKGGSKIENIGENKEPVHVKYLSYCDDTTEWKTLKAGNGGQTVDVSGETVSVYNQDLLDVDGDGDKEFAFIHAVEATDAADLACYGLVTRGGGYDSANELFGGNKNGYGLTNRFSFSPSLCGGRKALGVRFDLYVSDTKIFLAKGVEDLTVLKSLQDMTKEEREAVCTDSILDARFSLQISSNGNNSEAIIWSGTLQEIFGTVLYVGQWNTVYLDFATATETDKYDGTFDPSAMNYMKLHSIEGVTSQQGTFRFIGDLTVAIDDFEAIYQIPEVPEEPEQNSAIWNCESTTVSGGVLSLDKILKTTGIGSLSGVLNGTFSDAMSAYKLERKLIYWMDVSDMTHFCFDLYVSDADVLNGTIMIVELGSAYPFDDNEIQLDWTIDGLQDGWNHIELELSQFDAVGSTAFVPENLLRLRIYNESEIVSLEDTKIAFDSIYFTDLPCGVTVS